MMKKKNKTRSIYIPEGYFKVLENAMQITEATGESFNKAFLRGLELYVGVNYYKVQEKERFEYVKERESVEQEIGKLMYDLKSSKGAQRKKIGNEIKVKEERLKFVDEKCRELYMEMHPEEFFLNSDFKQAIEQVWKSFEWMLKGLFNVVPKGQWDSMVKLFIKNINLEYKSRLTD